MEGKEKEYLFLSVCYQLGSFLQPKHNLNWLRDHNKLWKILTEMGIPDHLTCLLRNLFAGQEATIRIGHGRKDWFQIGKGVHQGYILSPFTVLMFFFLVYFTLYNRLQFHPPHQNSSFCFLSICVLSSKMSLLQTPYS